MAEETSVDIRRRKPIVVEFIHVGEEARTYFIGKSLEDIYADTNQGREFAGQAYISHEFLSLDEAKELDLGFLRRGLLAVMLGSQRSYMLGQPNTGYKSFQKFLEENFSDLGEVAGEVLGKASKV